jgi:subtilisin-like proprotein convertase family protein
LDYESIRVHLTQAPREFTREGNTKPLHLDVPRADGTVETFAIVESKLVGDRVYNEYPLVRSYAGYSLKNAKTRIKITMSPYWGFQGTIRREDKEFEYIEQLVKEQNTLYMVYDRAAFPAKFYRPDLQSEPDFVPLPEIAEQHSHDEALPTSTMPEPAERGVTTDPVTLKIYRFACATTGEFGQDHGGTVANLLPAMVNYVAQLNAIYEPELAIRLILIDNVEAILFTNPDTDPYTGTLVPGWREQNPEAMIQAIGFNQYDIGHVFARYIEGPILGQASLSSCCTDFKGLGCSGGNLPYGPAFINTIGHEIGHQWSAQHTWNYCQGPANGVACEPGSGTTIMSYAGACGSDNISGAGLGLYYNVCSLSQIREFVQSGAGSTCGVNQIVENHPPQVTIVTPQNLTIPARTPFELTASAVDQDGDVLSYCWEQADTGPSVALGQASLNSPLFRSYEPTPSPVRTFPRIQTIVANQNNPAELLPTYTRNMKFAITVRDDKMGGGGVNVDTIKVAVNANAGPFRVSYPNTNTVTWHPGEYQYVTWAVANTDLPPVNSKTVNVKMSTDGGLTYPITLAANQPNSGSACILVPNNIGANNRIRVEAADHIFFDISNTNFKIEAASTPGFAICTDAANAQACLPGTFTLGVGNSAWAGFNEMITYSADGVPAGATATFAPNPAPAGTDVTMTIDFTGVAEGAYPISVNASSATLADTAVVTTTVVSNNFAAFALSAPADGSSGVSQSPLLQWALVEDATHYHVQVATSPSFAAGTIKLDNANVTGNSLTAAAGLVKGTAYYWRVRPLNECGSGDWAGPFVFATQVDACATFSAQDLPKNIPSNSTVPVESTITISGAGAVSDVNVKKIGLNHNAFNQIEVRLVPPSGGAGVLLFKNKCGLSSLTMDAGFDDASNITTFPCPANGGVILRPTGVLADLNGLAGSGDWKLWIKDNEVGSGGTINSFELEVCSAAALNAPFIVNNNILTLQPGTNAPITTSLLKTDDADNTPAQLTYTIITVPQNGILDLAGLGQVKTGDQFTQAQLDAGALRYFDYGVSYATDAFRFAVTDGNGGMVSATFTISAILAAKEVVSGPAFSLSPNPATESVRLDFGTGLTSDVTVLIQDASGKTVRNLQLNSGLTTRSINLNGIPSGMYVVAVRSASGVAVRKLVVR